MQTYDYYEIKKTAEKEYQRWVEKTAGDQAMHDELIELAGNDEEIIDAFYTDLHFGTSGLRGLMGPGTNRINAYVIRRATQGLANYLKRKKDLASVVISYDSRKDSDYFARETAAVLNGNGIKTYVFESLRPTPELSFAVRTLGCKSGIVITASHNPSKYNGYKAYWDDGCQVLSPMDHEIIDEVSEKVRKLKFSGKLSLRTALVYDGRLSPSVAADRYFDFLIPAERFFAS